MAFGKALYYKKKLNSNDGVCNHNNFILKVILIIIPYTQLRSNSNLKSNTGL
ncbi:hypothetical protein BCR32DRAFT_283517 [Anaeromyces robustus]|uniref:Uncharacterized protein n=1 Tax=Anaeromyces robustus TaxID=1754192 RepID=A0A1Y1WUA1_9FUNG|nr:hypothetical protein BCR32DRAFT_283517 [Anaeromyces robustus]|eukprot:ORX77117.1 hypothetical protein BCR32DRAFT_283517 [Anaeromyces robustus]